MGVGWLVCPWHDAEGKRYDRLPAGDPSEYEQPAGSSDSAVSPEPDTANAIEGAGNSLPGSSDDPIVELASDESDSDAGALAGEEALALAA